MKNGEIVSINDYFPSNNLVLSGRIIPIMQSMASIAATAHKLNPHKLNPPDVQYTNNHVIYLDCGVATEDQVKAVVKKSIRDAKERLQRPIETQFMTNVVNRSGRPVGYTYIWFTNPEVFNMLIGKNPDGSERIEYIDDPDWVAPEQPREAVDLLSSKFSSLSWADQCEEEERYICPKVKRTLPPLMTLDPIEYVGDQKAQMVQLMIDKMKRAGTWKDGCVVTAPDRIELVPAPAFCSPVEDEYNPETICATKVPPWITEADVKNVFRPFASDPVREVQKKINNVLVKDTFPFVLIVKGKEQRMVFVTFDRNTHDAQFALLMTRKVDFFKNIPADAKPAKGKSKSSSEKSQEPEIAPGTYRCQLVFNHARREARH